jgi:hypothetical protein
LPKEQRQTEEQAARLAMEIKDRYKFHGGAADPYQTIKAWSVRYRSKTEDWSDDRFLFPLHGGCWPCFDPLWPGLKSTVASFEKVTCITHVNERLRTAFHVAASTVYERLAPLGKQANDMTDLNNEVCELSVDELDVVSGGEMSLWGYLAAAYAAGAANPPPPIQWPTMPTGPGATCPVGRNGQHG